MPGTFARRVGCRTRGRAAHACRCTPAAAGGPPPQQGPGPVLFRVEPRRRYPWPRSAAPGCLPAVGKDDGTTRSSARSIVPRAHGRSPEGTGPEGSGGTGHAPARRPVASERVRDGHRQRHPCAAHRLGSCGGRAVQLRPLDVPHEIFTSRAAMAPESLPPAVAVAGWRLPAERELNVLFETAEYARFAIRAAWAAMAWLNEGAEWVPVELAEIARWFEVWRPVLDEKNHQS